MAGTTHHKVLIVGGGTVSTALRISWGRGASDLLPAQQGADPRQQLPKAERSSAVFVLFDPSALSTGIYGRNQSRQAGTAI